MALDRAQLIELARANARASLNPAKKFSFNGEDLTAEALDKTFNYELNELGKTPQDFRNNQNLIFELMEVGLTEVLPVKVLQAYGAFADVKTYGNNDKPIFKVNISEASKKRAKQFVTKVGLAGRYETFKLDGYQLEVPTSAYGGAARVEWEELLDGRLTLNDYYQLVLEGLDEAIYREMAKALVSAVTSLQSTNKTTQTGFVEAEMDKLLQIADSYGKAEIYCTYEFAATMVPSTGWVSDDMRNQKWNNGYLGNYKSHRVIVLPQSFEDETNTKKVLDPSYAWIIPTGTGEKPIKVAMEGQTIVDEYVNKDRSREIQVYKKIGVGAKITNNICVYKNSSLA